MGTRISSGCGPAKPVAGPNKWLNLGGTGHGLYWIWSELPPCSSLHCSPKIGVKGAQAAPTLERLVRLYRNMRLRDRALGRGRKAQKDKEALPKAYPLESGDWSSCDSSEDESGWDAATAPYGFGPGSARSCPIDAM